MCRKKVFSLLGKKSAFWSQYKKKWNENETIFHDEFRLLLCTSIEQAAETLSLSPTRKYFSSSSLHIQFSYGNILSFSSLILKFFSRIFPNFLTVVVDVLALSWALKSSSGSLPRRRVSDDDVGEGKKEALLFAGCWFVVVSKRRHFFSLRKREKIFLAQYHSSLLLLSSRLFFLVFTSQSCSGENRTIFWRCGGKIRLARGARESWKGGGEWGAKREWEMREYAKDIVHFFLLCVKQRRSGAKNNRSSLETESIHRNIKYLSTGFLK